MQITLFNADVPPVICQQCDPFFDLLRDSIRHPEKLKEYTKSIIALFKYELQEKSAKNYRIFIILAECINFVNFNLIDSVLNDIIT